MQIQFENLDTLVNSIKDNVVTVTNENDIEFDKVFCSVGMSFFFEKNGKLLMNSEINKPVELQYYASGSLPTKSSLML